MAEFILSAFADEITPDFDGQLEALKKLNIPLLELRGVDGKSFTQLTDAEVSAVGGKLKKAGIGLSALGSPIGKIADAVLKDAGLSESANIVARTTTAPEMITALSTGECDAAVVWKENAAKSEEVEILDLEGMDKYIKVIPAASLSCSTNDEALAEFLEYLDSDEAAAVWTKYGYEKA